MHNSKLIINNEIIHRSQLTTHRSARSDACQGKNSQLITHNLRSYNEQDKQTIYR